MSSELEQWANRVASFGGRIGSFENVDALHKALETSNLGSREVLRVSGATLQLPESITLAQVKLPIPVAMDVVFSFDKLGFGPFNGGVGGFPGFPAGLRPGAGFIRLAWGVNGGTQMTAEVDAAQGWRHRFVASYMRVDYVPLDPNAGAPWQVQPGQPGDIGIRASIVPSDGSAQSKLTRTRYFPDYAGVQNAIRYVPEWANEYEVGFFSAAPTLATDYFVSFLDTNFATVGGFRTDAVAGQYPSYLSHLGPKKVPMQAVMMAFGLLVAGQQMEAPQMTFGLAL